MKIHRDFQQGSVDWLLARAGKITASEMDALISPLGKIRTGDGVRTYLNQKLCELWTGGPLPALQGIFDMEQGQFLEERAKPAFTLHTGIEIKNVAFIETDDGRAGCSPDAMAGNIGVEIKCPRIDTHVGYLLAGVLPKQYVAQVQASMFVAECNQWHFFSYNRQLPSLHLIIDRDDDFQKNLREAIDGFVYALDAAMDKLIDLNGGERPKRSTLSKPEPVLSDDRPDVAMP